MPALPFMKLYVSDYLADTTHLTTEEHGAYLLLLMNYWQTEKPLNNRNNRLAHVVHLSIQRWEDVKQTLSEFFDITDDVWTHHRVDADLQAVLEVSTKRSFAGKKGARSRANARLSVGTSPIEQGLSNGSTSESPLINYKDKDKGKDTDANGDADANTDANTDVERNKERKGNKERELNREIKRILKAHRLKQNELLELSNQIRGMQK